MSIMETKDLEKKYKVWVVLLSILIPIVVAFLFTVKIEGLDFSILPHIYAPINGLTAVLLVMAVLAVKRGEIKKHEKYIKFAMLCSVLFLVLYVLYHMTSEPTLYGDLNKNEEIEDSELNEFSSTRGFYFFMLISHIILSITVIPLVLFSYLKGISGKVKEHKNLVKYTFPIWLYVAVSGVVVYLMIKPFYA